MTFGHFLVIPKERVYNIVDSAALVNDLELIREMKAHWEDFVSLRTNRQMLLERFRLAMDTQFKECIKLAGSNADLVARVKEEFSFVVETFEQFSHRFLKLDKGDFIAGFHVDPDHSVGHLHMHVLPTPLRFREFSTTEHDEKTIPFEAIEKAQKLRLLRD